MSSETKQHERMVDNPSNHRRISLMDFAFHNDGDHHMIRLFFAAFLIALSPAVPESITVPEGGAGVVTIYEEGMS